MKIELGVKTDAIEYRYTYDWLFRLLQEQEISLVQLGSFFELYSLDEEYFYELRRTAESHGIRVKSCFTAHRELGGFLTGNKHLVAAARGAYERYIHVASVLGADYIGSNPGAVYRDRPELKEPGIRCYLDHMKELAEIAHSAGIKGLTIEPMSSISEPPSLQEEIDMMMHELAAYHESRPDSTVPVYLCGDISHGVYDYKKRKVHDHYDLFEHEIPYMAEFHFKNTDRYYHSTFGFSSEERNVGVVDLKRLEHLITKNKARWPVDDVVGYLELSGPKLGRDYTDYQLQSMLVASIAALKRVFR